MKPLGDGRFLAEYSTEVCKECKNYRGDKRIRCKLKNPWSEYIPIHYIGKTDGMKVYRCEKMEPL